MPAPAEVKRAYHSSSRNFHPDANRHPEASCATPSHAIAKRITEAYAVLRDPRRAPGLRPQPRRAAQPCGCSSPTRLPRPIAAPRRSAAAARRKGGSSSSSREADIARGNWAAAARNLQTALTFEPDNALFKERSTRPGEEGAARDRAERLGLTGACAGWHAASPAGGSPPMCCPRPPPPQADRARSSSS